MSSRRSHCMLPSNNNQIESRPLERKRKLCLSGRPNDGLIDCLACAQSPLVSKSQTTPSVSLCIVSRACKWCLLIKLVLRSARRTLPNEQQVSARRNIILAEHFRFYHCQLIRSPELEFDSEHGRRINKFHFSEQCRSLPHTRSSTY